MTRQREWQKRQQAAGNCTICGRRRAGNAMHCEPCRVKVARRRRERYAARRQGKP